MTDSDTSRLSRRVRNKLRMLVVLAVIFLGLAMWHLVVDAQEWRWAFVGIAMGLAIGGILAIFDDYVWHAGENQVVQESSVMATLLLALYLVFTVSRNQILDDWITRPEALGMVTSWLSLSAMAMRLYRMRREIGEALRVQPGTAI